MKCNKINGTLLLSDHKQVVKDGIFPVRLIETQADLLANDISHNRW